MHLPPYLINLDQRPRPAASMPLANYEADWSFVFQPKSNLRHKGETKNFFILFLKQTNKPLDFSDYSSQSNIFYQHTLTCTELRWRRTTKVLLPSPIPWKQKRTVNIKVTSWYKGNPSFKLLDASDYIISLMSLGVTVVKQTGIPIWWFDWSRFQAFCSTHRMAMILIHSSVCASLLSHQPSPRHQAQAFINPEPSTMPLTYNPPLCFQQWALL